MDAERLSIELAQRAAAAQFGVPLHQLGDFGAIGWRSPPRYATWDLEADAFELVGPDRDT